MNLWKGMLMDKTIYDLDLHESSDFAYFSVLRVAGGWLYKSANQPPVFVPFNSEFHAANTKQWGDNPHVGVIEEAAQRVAEYKYDPSKYKKLPSGEYRKDKDMTDKYDFKGALEELSLIEPHTKGMSINGGVGELGTFAKRNLKLIQSALRLADRLQRG